MKLGNLLLELSQNPELLHRFLQRLASKVSSTSTELKLSSSFIKDLEHLSRDKLFDALEILLEAEFAEIVSNDIFTHISYVFSSYQKVFLEGESSEGSSMSKNRIYSPENLAQMMKWIFNVESIPDINRFIGEKLEYNNQDKASLQQHLERYFINQFYRNGEKVLMLVSIMPDYHREVYEKAFVHLQEATGRDIQLSAFEIESYLHFSLIDNEFYCFEPMHSKSLYARVNQTPLERGNYFAIGDSSIEIINVHESIHICIKNENTAYRNETTIDFSATECTIGSGKDCSICVDDMSLKDRHVQLFFNQQWFLKAVEDAEVWKYTSTNDNQTLIIEPKTQIKIGTTVIIFERLF